ncbi:hypothetical protein CIHG_04548 [Coccidioides immitis H538.4]|uniref:PEP phosphonomutase n=1 Tax=Coccidioides immitis H538.4 TaxID=396776 RepID=A0A0J8RS35_COCIT|nr:hypothetical protein CIHG_04548 [Coccidioides immitis H538.4]
MKELGGRMKKAFGTSTLLFYGRDDGISDPQSLEGVRSLTLVDFHFNSNICSFGPQTPVNHCVFALLGFHAVLLLSHRCSVDGSDHTTIDVNAIPRRPSKQHYPSRRGAVRNIYSHNKVSFFRPPIVRNMSSADARALQLRQLHTPGKPIVFANVYDPATAKIVASNPSSAALATASFAVAAVHGLDDDDMDLETNVAAVKPIATVAIKHGKPLTVDLQDGYGDRLEEAIEQIIVAGASGCNLEDRDNTTGKLFPLDVAVDRVRRRCSARKPECPTSFSMLERMLLWPTMTLKMPLFAERPFLRPAQPQPLFGAVSARFDSR